VQADLTLNDRMVDLVEEGFDVAVRIARKVDPGLVARPITHARVVACASPDYLKRHGVPRTPEDLAKHNCMSYAYTGQQHQWRFSRRDREQTVKVAGNLNANNGDILCSAAANGLGVIMQPTFLAHELLRTKRLVRVLEGWEPEGFTVFAVYPSRQFLTAKVRTFIDFLVEHFGDKPFWDSAID
jgi:DNA-binding transcriptional LysR family regulator